MKFRGLFKLAFRLNTRFSWIFSNQITILILIFVTSRIIFAIILGPVTALAPDEVSYLGVYNQVYHGQFYAENFPGWPSNNVIFLKIIYFPTWLLQGCGLEPILALRASSIIYSTITIAILLRKLEIVNINRFVKLSFVTLLFLPTFFIWSTLGLREPFLYLSFIGIFVILAKSNQTKVDLVILFTLSAMLLLVKSQIYLLVVISCIGIFFCEAIFYKKRLSVNAIKLSLCLILPIVIFFHIFQDTLQGAHNYYTFSVEKQLNSNTNPQQDASPSGRTLLGLKEQLNSNTNPQGTIISKASDVGLGVLNSSERLVNTFFGENIPIQSFPQGKINSMASLLVGSISFLLGPTIQDAGSSVFMILLSLENILFLILAFIIVFNLVRNFSKISQSIQRTTFMLLGFTLIFILMSSVTETNWGTAYRHKSILFMVVVLILVCYGKYSSEKFNFSLISRSIQKINSSKKWIKRWPGTQ